MVRNLWHFFLPLSALLLPVPVVADVSVCNDTESLQTMAVGHEVDSGAVVTRGWWALSPGACTTVLEGPRPAAVFLRLRSSGWTMTQAETPLCTAVAPFTLRNDTDCAAQGGDAAGFLRVDLNRIDADTTLALSTVLDRSDASTPDTMAQLQGEWHAVEDAAERMIVSGGQRQTFYGDTPTGTEDVAPVTACGAADGPGPFLRSRDTRSGDVTCYAIETIGPDRLVLTHLPRGNRLVYEKRQ